MAREESDIIVVGAGLAGLAAALEIQAAGRSAHVVEARDRAGGLCSTEEWDGLEYSIACNEFGGGLVRRARALGVRQRFRSVGARFVIGRPGHARSYCTPLRPASLGPWLRRLPDLARLGLALRRAGDDPTTLGGVLDAIDASLALRELAGILAYPIATPTSELALASLRAEISKELAYESANSFVAEGGPQHFANALAERFRELGGRLDLGQRVLGIERHGDGFCVATETGELRARAVVSSATPAAYCAPEGSHPGLAPTTLRLRLRGDAPLPKGLHTLVRLHGQSDSALRCWRAGELPAPFDYHFFPCETATEGDASIAANLLFYTPAGREWRSDELARASDTALAGLDSLLPGIARSIEGWQAVTPQELEARSGLSLAVVPHTMPPGAQKAAGYDEQSGIEYVGVRFGPAGEHAGSAWLSGTRAAQRLLGSEILAGR